MVEGSGTVVSTVPFVQFWRIGGSLKWNIPVIRILWRQSVWPISEQLPLE